MSFSPPTKTVQDVIRQVQRKFGDESGVQLENADIIMWINDACRAIVSENRILKVTATTPLVAGQADYNLTGLANPIYAIDSLLIDGQRVGNMNVAQAEESITQYDPQSLEQGFPQFWYEYGGVVTFWPVPNFAGTITIRYTAWPAAISLVTDVLPVPDDCFEDVCNYVLKQAYEMDENAQMAQMKAEEFSTSLLKRGEEVRTAQNMTYETITVYDLEGY